nr:MAG TPA: hypothetical protein [Caudoviricetes sp.]
MRPNQFDESVKIKWLSKLDGMLFEEIFKTHEGCPAETFTQYTESDGEKELLVPAPYDQDVYNYFLQAQIDAENGEAAKYNQSITLYNAAVKLFGDWYNRTHMPIAAARALLF